MPRPSRLAVAVVGVVLALLATLGIAACGSGGGDSATSIVKDTFSGSKSIKSGNLDVVIDFSGRGGQGATQGPIGLKLTGPFQTVGQGQLPNFDVKAAISAAGKQQGLGAVSTGDKGFIEISGRAYVVPASVYAQFKQGFRQSQADNAKGKRKTTLGALGIDPVTWLKDPKVQDDERVGGVDTKHVSAGVDVPKFVDDLNRLVNKTRLSGGASGKAVPSISAGQKQQIVDAVKDARFDVWSGKDDKVLRRLAVRLDLQARNGQTAGGLIGGTLGFSLTISELNQAQTIAEPANARPWSELQKQIAGLNLGSLGGVAGSGGASSGGSGSGGSASSGSGSGGSSSGGSSGQDAKAQAYIDCISKAQGDVGKAQKCADLLKP
jgi:hypothetical protein